MELLKYLNYLIRFKVGQTVNTFDSKTIPWAQEYTKVKTFQGHSFDSSREDLTACTSWASRKLRQALRIPKRAIAIPERERRGKPTGLPVFCFGFLLYLQFSINLLEEALALRRLSKNYLLNWPKFLWGSFENCFWSHFVFYKFRPIKQRTHPIVPTIFENLLLGKAIEVDLKQRFS